MRPPRVLIAVAFFVTAVFLTFLSLRSSHSHNIIAPSTSRPRTGIQSFLSFRAPFSLFPPNAIITLTHENSTAFLARPAAFGPSLPTEGLKGQVWIGSGFGDDAGTEGELGCSDVPGWIDNYAKSGTVTSDGAKVTDGRLVTAATKLSERGTTDDIPLYGRPAVSDKRSDGKSENAEPTIDDWTDDYLHHPLPGSTMSKLTDSQVAEPNSNHADIQSIQEGAEITGKVVLLSRGGCGFLEKVKWSQRRGAIALIVGDDVKGGPLIQMYARGDTSNVTIPSIFTSRTTAHLLSSLVGSGSFIEDLIDENGKPTLKVDSTRKHKKEKKKSNSNPTFTTTTGLAKATTTARATSKVSNKKSTVAEDKSAPMTTERPGWFKAIVFGTSSSKSKSDSSRPPSSGQLDWVLVDEWKDDDTSNTQKIPKKKTEQKLDINRAQQKNKGADDFVIGVQDWRDPDLVGSKENEVKAGKKSAAETTRRPPRPTKTGKKHTGGALQEIPEYIPPLRGGSITPGSGEYGGRVTPEEAKAREEQEGRDTTATSGKSKGILNAIFGDDEEDIEFSTFSSSHDSVNALGNENNDDEEYDGLWVTLTPTSGASPFLDTLLVLVVSPLVTLTVVYTLLLVRSRIRRRRWRAPKSVVERLPVRTYQTIATPGSQSPRLPSPISSSPTTPLLQSTSPPRSRPRSRTTTGIPDPGDLVRVNSQPLHIQSVPPPRGSEHEKNVGVSTEWRKYMGKQVECVVCLEEYVDGVSRVMSLPCGHEFHVDCITPWLTTRRRTCPICKGDVVRSLARGLPSGPRYEPYHDDSDDDIQAQAAETVNESSSSTLPIPPSIHNDDLERGIPSSPNRQQRPSLLESWRNILTTSLGIRSRGSRRNQEDRNR